VGKKQLATGKWQLAKPSLLKNVPTSKAARASTCGGQSHFETYSRAFAEEILQATASKPFFP
jgi:hypothetical protein